MDFRGQCFIILCLYLCSPCRAIQLPTLAINSSTITVSGFSSGGCFATQFHIAFSKTISGVGVFAGAPYLSAYAGTDPEDLISITETLASQGDIDGLENIDGDKVYIFQGLLDWITPWAQAGRIHNMYKAWTAETNIEEKSDLNAAHAFPSDNYGSSCGQLNPPFYINNCHYSGAESVFSSLYGSSSSTSPKGELSQFEQGEFFDDHPHQFSMDNQGFLYIPPRCQNGDRLCHLHVHFHGCGMGKHFIGDNFIKHSSLLDVAEALDVVFLFPQVTSLTPENKDGCWDWWGYLGDADGYGYATKSGLQMSGIYKMVERLTGFNQI